MIIKKKMVLLLFLLVLMTYLKKGFAHFCMQGERPSSISLFLRGRTFEEFPWLASLIHPTG